MVDKARVERIRSEVHAKTAAADQLMGRVSDDTFTAAIALIKARIIEHERFFLGGLDNVNVVNVGMWLDGAEVMLGGEYAMLRYYEDEARARDYKITLVP